MPDIQKKKNKQKKRKSKEKPVRSPAVKFSRRGLLVAALGLMALAVNYALVLERPLVDTFVQQYLSMVPEIWRMGLVAFLLPLVIVVTGLVLFFMGKRVERRYVGAASNAHLLAVRGLTLLDLIISVQAGSPHDKDRLLKEDRRRAKTIALLHEMLSKSGVQSVSAPEFIRKVCHDTAGIMAPDRARLLMDLAPVMLSPDTALACGVIVSELVSNALGSAFVEIEQPEIQVCFCTVGKNMAELKVSDNGIGIPTRLDVDKLVTVGLRLVRKLTGHLKGKVDFEVSNGTTVTIRFPL
jgi:two-component sensor histidine kinase